MIYHSLFAVALAALFCMLSLLDREDSEDESSIDQP